jgi:hypothetical protein
MATLLTGRYDLWSGSPALIKDEKSKRAGYYGQRIKVKAFRQGQKGWIFQPRESKVDCRYK